MTTTIKFNGQKIKAIAKDSDLAFQDEKTLKRFAKANAEKIISMADKVSGTCEIRGVLFVIY